MHFSVFVLIAGKEGKTDNSPNIWPIKDKEIRQVITGFVPNFEWCNNTAQRRVLEKWILETNWENDWGSVILPTWTWRQPPPAATAPPSGHPFGPERGAELLRFHRSVSLLFLKNWATYQHLWKGGGTATDSIQAAVSVTHSGESKMVSNTVKFPEFRPT